jgi:hypothetical protein
VLRDECTTLRQPRVPNGVSGDGREPDATIVVIARPLRPHRTAPPGGPEVPVRTVIELKAIALFPQFTFSRAV